MPYFDALTGFGTLALATASFISIWNDKIRERRRYRPLITFDFYDIGEHENLGPQGFRHLHSHPIHPALLLSGTLRNISETPAIDCKLDIVYQDGLMSKPIHEIHDIKLHDGLGAGEHVKISKTLTLSDVDTKGSAVFAIGIAGIFSIGSQPVGVDWPAKIVFTYKNIFGDLFFTAYTMQMRTSLGNVAPTMVFKGSHAGEFSLKLITAKKSTWFE